MHFQTKEQIYKLLIELVQQKSISNTKDEILMADLIVKKLKMIPYFEQNPQHIFEVALDDQLGRKTICALLDKKSLNRDTLLMVSHFDTVGIDDASHVGASILDPEAYTKALSDVHLAQDVLKDLNSKEWLFGRGVMDMKPGVCYQISMLEYFSQLDDFDGNILVSFVPDEETNSKGVLKAIPEINRILAANNLNAIVALNNEPDFASFPGDEGKYVYVGTVGKLLAGFYCYGATTHVGESLSGLNANLLAAKVIDLMELNSLFSDEIAGEVSMPPTALKFEDHKELYNVQTPISAHVYYNIQTFTFTPKQVMDKMLEVSRIAADQAFEKLVTAQEIYRKKTGLEINANNLKVRVMTYSELKLAVYDSANESEITEIESEFKKILDNPAFDDRMHCVKMIETLLKYDRDNSPKIIAFFAPPYYPHVRMKQDVLAHQHVLNCAKKIVSSAENNFGEKLKIQQYFQGLCDLSYFALQDAQSVMTSLEPNMPSFGYQYDVPLEEIAKLDVPIINYGAHGKDPHKYTERVLVDYSCETVVVLLKELIQLLFEK